MLIRSLVALLASCICLLAVIAKPVRSAPFRYYVATIGNDSWSGQLAAPNFAKTDGPFLTVARALVALRHLRQVVRTKSPVEGQIIVRTGFYPLAEPLQLTAEDSRLAIFAYPDENPVLSGGVKLTGWDTTDPNRWTLKIPDALPSFQQIYVNDSRRMRPRLPKQGYFFASGEGDSTDGKGFNRFRYPEGSIRANWQNRDAVEIVPFHIWGVSRMRIADVNPIEHQVTLKGHTATAEFWQKIAKGGRFIVENVKEALSERGEWYLDTKTRLLTYLPLIGETPQTTVVFAPVLPYLLSFDGVERVRVQGITFAHAAYILPEAGRSFPQAEADLGGAIRLTNSTSVTFERCAVQHTGEYGMEIGTNCRMISVRRSVFTDLGAGGIKIGLTTFEPDAKKITGYVTVSDCLIAHGGRIHPAAVGIWMGHTPYNTIEHNDITDFYYTGISPGWSWGYGDSGCHHNTIAYNHIWKIGQGVLSDMGGIYTLGVSTGTVLHHNKIHDVDSFDYGGWGIYFDEGTTDVTASDNLVYRTKSAPFHQHYGNNNRVVNNILALGREAQLMRTRVEDHLSFTIERNIVYWREGPLLGSDWSGDKYILHNNLYWNAAGQTVAVPQDSGAVIADPLFVAPEKDDFRLQPNSPASRIGFIPFDMNAAGRRDETPYTKNVIPAWPLFPKPKPISEDFEAVRVGGQPNGAVTVEDADVRTATVRVSNEMAATGQQSLRFVDAVGQKFPYNPHLFYQPRFDEGIFIGKFALNWKTGAIFLHEWRDSANPFKTGPALRVAADGTLFANDRELLKIPAGVWVRFEITCGLGSKATGNYNLKVIFPTRMPPRTFKNLPCVSGKAFAQVRWWGFVSNADASTQFFLDDLFLGEIKSEK